MDNNTIKILLAGQLRLVLESGSIRTLLEGMIESAQNSQDEDYVPVINFRQAQNTLDAIAMLAKLVVDNDTKVEVAEKSVKKNDEPENNNLRIIMPNGESIRLSDLKNTKL